jgi:hypothetical protein
MIVEIYSDIPALVTTYLPVQDFWLDAVPSWPKSRFRQTSVTVTPVILYLSQQSSGLDEALGTQVDVQKLVIISTPMLSTD